MKCQGSVSSEDASGMWKYPGTGELCNEGRGAVLVAALSFILRHFLLPPELVGVPGSSSECGVGEVNFRNWGQEG